MIKIEQGALCDFCEENCNTKRDTCEGCRCEEATGMYLEDHGIIEDNLSAKTFKGLTLGDTVYHVVDDGTAPVIKKRIINSISKINDGDPLKLHYESEMVIMPEVESGQAEFGNLFICKKAAEKKLEEICLDRIVLLSKIIGKLG